ncbi:magnesium transporter [Candidatus Uhrbacteria bacterium]|nr:magnesium transporter [Candidatus Uhrbacteria bacterium]
MTGQEKKPLGGRVSGRYRPETAGRLMLTAVPTVSESALIGDVERLLTRKIADFDTINYIYVLDGEGRLKGISSVKEVFRTPKNRPINEVMARKIVSVHPHTDQERAALSALKHGFKAIPVVGHDGIFLGVLPSDVILGILNREATEDIMRFGGVYRSSGGFDDILVMTPLQSIRHRLPWLLLGLAGGLLVARIVGGFEETLSDNLVLAAFIPLVVYMADAVGAQMEAFIIRDLATDPNLRFGNYLVRQLSAVFLIGVIAGGLSFLASLITYRDYAVSVVLGISLLFAVLTSVLTGLIVPYAFSRMRMDPANASGPIATIIQDILSVVVYFSVASLVL